MTPPGISGPSIRVAAILLGLLPLQACSPTYNWREFRPQDASVAALFPCKPEHARRELSFERITLSMQMHSCEAGGRIFALAHAATPAGAAPAEILKALRVATSTNMGSATLTEASQALPGLAGGRSATRLRWAANREGRALNLDTLLFSAEATVYQASIVGPSLDADVADTFFSGLSMRK